MSPNGTLIVPLDELRQISLFLNGLISQSDVKVGIVTRGIEDSIQKVINYLLGEHSLSVGDEPKLFNLVPVVNCRLRSQKSSPGAKSSAAPAERSK